MNRGARFRSAIARTAAAALIAGSTFAQQAYADQPYDPPVGSRWIIQRDLLNERVIKENGREDKRGYLMKITAEFTIDAKTADGFRMTYARRAFSYDGNEDDPVVMRAALAALNNIKLQITTDRSGKPLRVENYDEIRDGLRKAIDRVSSSNAEPREATALRDLLSQMLKIDAVRAAELYVDEMASLAMGQNTGMKTGDVRRWTENTPNPLGKPMVKHVSLSLVSADAASGVNRLRLTESTEPESLRQFLIDMTRRTGGDVSDLQKMTLSQDAWTEIEVAGGMTRSLRRESITANALGQNSRRITSRKLVTVTAGN